MALAREVGELVSVLQWMTEIEFAGLKGPTILTATSSRTRSAVAVADGPAGAVDVVDDADLLALERRQHPVGPGGRLRFGAGCARDDQREEGGDEGEQADLRPALGGSHGMTLRRSGEGGKVPSALGSGWVAGWLGDRRRALARLSSPLGRVAELADALASGASVRKDVGVQVPPRPPQNP